MINTLSGDDIQKGINCLSKRGRYIELSMTAIKSANNIDLSHFSNNQSFIGIDLRKLLMDDPDYGKDLWEECMELIEKGIVKSTLSKTFDLKDYKEAYHHLERRENIGKVVVNVKDRNISSFINPSVNTTQLALMEKNPNTEIAIIGMSGTFPEAEDANKLWANILSERMAKINTEQAWLGIEDLMPDVYMEQTGLTEQEFSLMSRQYQLVFSALGRCMKESGLTKEDFYGSRTGVFIAAAQTMDSATINGNRMAEYHAAHMLPAKVSYQLDLRGPSEVVNVSCVSSYLALHQAVQSIKWGECDQAIVGGVNIITKETSDYGGSTDLMSLISEKAQMKSFDDEADGIIRSEGVGIIIIKRLEQAKQDGNKIHAMIKGTSFGHGGKNLSWEAPNPKGIKDFIRKSIDRAGIDTATIDYIEAHGIANLMADAIELGAINNTYKSLSSDPNKKWHVSSIKPTVGHSELASGMASLIKVIKAFEHKMIPGIPGLEKVNTELDPNHSMILKQESRFWPNGVHPRRAALNSYAVGGVNAHIIVEEYTAEKYTSENNSRSNGAIRAVRPEKHRVPVNDNMPVQNETKEQLPAIETLSHVTKPETKFSNKPTFRLLHSNCSTIDRFKFTSTFHRDDELISDCLIHENYYIPQMVQLEMYNVLGKSITNEKVTQIKDVIWHTPALVKDEFIELSASLITEGTTFSVDITAHEGEYKSKYSEALISFNHIEKSRNRSLSKLFEGFSEKIEGMSFYEKLYDRSGVAYGNTYRAIKEFYLKKNESLAKVSPSIQAGILFPLDLLEAVTQVTLFTHCSSGNVQKVFPKQVGQLLLYDNPHKVSWIHVKNKEKGLFNVEMLSENGEVIISMDSFRLDVFEGEIGFTKEERQQKEEKLIMPVESTGYVNPVSTNDVQTNESDIENWLVETLKDKLEIPENEIDKDLAFDALGLSSLQVVRLIEETEKNYAIEIDYNDLLVNPTIRKMALYIQNKGGQGERIIEDNKDMEWPTYIKGYVSIGTEELEAIKRVIESKRLFRYDNRPYEESECGSFERELCAKFGVKYALAVSSGTAALTLSLLSLSLKKGDKVGCSSYTFTATPSAIVQAGLTPKLIECDENLHMSLSDLEKKIQGLKALVVVHMRGSASPIKEILEIAKKYNVPVVEDAVPVLGLQVENKYLGTFGELGSFSTQSDKSINSGEGGFILTDNLALYAKLTVLSGAYEKAFYKHFDSFDLQLSFDPLELPLYNFRMSEITAAICRAQLLKLSERVNTLKKNYHFLLQKLDDFGEYIIVRKPFYEDAVIGDTIQLKCRDKAKTSRLYKHLKNGNIDCTFLNSEEEVNVRCFWNWKYLGMSTEESIADYPLSYEYISSYIDIPLSPLLKQDDIIYLIEKIKQFTQ